MGRSNNKRRRFAKEHGGTFIPKTVKSKTRNRANKQRFQSPGAAGKKLAYSKVVTKHGKIKQRKFKAGGYNASGKFGSARGMKKKGGKKK